MTTPGQTSPDITAPTPETGHDEPVAFARLYGEALTELPADLYIPPEALEIFLEAFEGPLDLLLYLIRRQNFNILDIPMAQLTEQYLIYVDQIRQHKLELAAEYLLMAAALVEIKSRMLLPSVKSQDAEEADDPRAELVRRLMEYERIKLAASKLDDMPKLGDDFFTTSIPIPKDVAPRWPDVVPVDLYNAFTEIIRRSKLTTSHTVGKQGLSVREHMSAILRRLQTTGFVEFHDLFDVTEGVAVLIVHFLALLELARESLVEITQA
ncbi:segregation/condensation protein A, partial [Oxalobacter sp. OttesenSCG-928-P03]|nr:segregation/condensation protein A [Oxalobacter sp. OttesenSCG-928-P03]